MRVKRFGPGWRWWLALGFGVVARVQAEPDPVMYRDGPGRFEVAALDSAGAQRVIGLADEGWQSLAVPLGLPEGFSSPVFVRLIPPAEWSGPAAFRTIVEAGGVVSVRIKWDAATPEPLLRRALVQALLLRLAVAEHGVTERLVAPWWLEQAAAGWWRTRLDGAQLDALKQESARLTPPPLAELLTGERGPDVSRARDAGAVWLLLFLQGESGAGGEWPSFLRRLLAGEEPNQALEVSFPGRFADATERELWWQTGWHRLRRVQTLPMMEARESRAALSDAARFVFGQDDGSDVVMPLRQVLSRAREPVVSEELAGRVAALNRIIPALHPFYRNAGLSLAAALGTRSTATERRDVLCRTFESDWRDATELESATAAVLDSLDHRH